MFPHLSTIKIFLLCVVLQADYKCTTYMLTYKSTIFVSQGQSKWNYHKNSDCEV